MDNHFSDMPTTPMPVARPSRRRRRPWLVALVIVGILLVIGIGAGVLGNVMGLHLIPGSKARQAQATGTATSPQAGQLTSAASPTESPTRSTTPSSHTAPGATPTPNPALPSVTHNRPHLGGPFSDFIGKYGTPSNQGDGSSQNFWTGSDQSIDINVTRNEQGKVTLLNILGSASWSAQQTQNYCAQFLPDGAAQVSASGNQIEYQSSAGKIVLTLQAPSCSLSFAKG